MPGGGIVEPASGQGGVQAVEERHVGQQRDAQLAVGFLDGDLAARRLGRDVGGQPRRDDGVRLEEALVAPPLDANREGQRAGRQVDNRTGQVGREVGQFLLRGILLGEADEGQHRGRDRALAAEDVQRRAGAGAQGHGPQGLLHALGVDVAGEGLVGVVARIEGVDVPVPGPVGDLEVAGQRARDVPGVDFLFVVPRAVLYQPAADEGVGARLQREAERVERVGDVDTNGVQQVAVAGVGTHEQRQRTCLVGRLALDVAGADLEADRIGDVLRHDAEQADPLRGRQDVVEGLEVEPVGGGEALEARGRPGGVAGDVVGPLTHGQRLLQGEVQVAAGVRVGNDETAQRRAGAAAASEAGGGEGRGEPADRPVAGQDRVLLEVAAADDDARAVRASAPRDVEVLGEAVVVIAGADLSVGDEAFLAVLGDDVDDAGDGVRAIDRRGAFLQYLDAADHGGRDGVQIHRAGDAGRRRAGHPAQAVDQHQHPPAGQVAQVDFRRARAHAAAVGRIAEVAGVVELAVQATAGRGDALQDVDGRGQALLGDQRLVDLDDGLVAFQGAGADARAGDDDLIDTGRGGLGLGLGRAGAERQQRGRRSGRRKVGSHR